jgi:uncharacterized protein (TIGR03435 family)
MHRALATLALCFAGPACSQTPAVRFEVASIKPGNADLNSSSGIHTGHGHLDATNVTVIRCIMGAYGVGPHQISGAPAWLDSDRFAISAKADRPTNDDAVLMLMLQDLLADRFKLVLHRESRTIAALVLEVARSGAKMEKAEPGEASNNTSTSNTGITIDSRHTDMDSFAKILARKTDLPVVNHTGLEGIFNFQLHWTEGAEGASLFTAIQEQLGLRLRSQKLPVEILVIDHIEKPSEN